MFPTGLPRAGLLLLRLVCSVLVISGAVTTILGAPHTQTLILQSIAIAAARLLLALVELSMALAGANGIEHAVLLATLGVALAVLGPSSRAVGAKRSGRKRIQIND
jgi:hypothetical protein